MWSSYEVCQESFETRAVNILFAKKCTIYVHTLQSSPSASQRNSMHRCHDTMQSWKACSEMTLSSFVITSLMASTSLNLISLIMPLSRGKRKNYMRLNPGCRGAGQALRRSSAKKRRTDKAECVGAMEQPRVRIKRIAPSAARKFFSTRW